MSKKIPVDLISNYDYHFIIKELAKEFKKQFTYLGENTDKCITFIVPIEKESWISMASSFKKDKSKIRSFNPYRYVINGRKRY